jgi:hypothetical protein|tara:strand:+ start:618 stop:935 length:318 start_codon:yes stop_codon:yes gene_type:complete
MNMKYTKGKWEARCQVDDPNVYSDERCEGEEFDVYVVHPPRHLLGNRETLIADHISAGDANLIANSPLMLEALKMVVDYHDRDEDNETDLHFENARDAIAKAEGK